MYSIRIYAVGLVFTGVLVMLAAAPFSLWWELNSSFALYAAHNHAALDSQQVALLVLVCLCAGIGLLGSLTIFTLYETTFFLVFRAGAWVRDRAFPKKVVLSGRAVERKVDSI